MKILVVDNNEFVQYVCRFVFEKLGHEVDVAQSGHTALNMLSEKHYDFLFLELFLRDMSGLNILEKLKNHNTIPVIMTGYHSVDLIKKAVELGAVSHIFKPLDADNLEAMLVICKKRHEIEQAREEAKQKLFDSQQKYKTLVDSISEGIAIIQEKKVRFINKSMAEMLGMKLMKVLNKDFKEVFAPFQADRVYQRMLQFIETTTPIEGNFGFENFQNKRFTLFVTANKMTFQNKPADMFVFNDITERIELTKNMKKIEERYRILHEHASDAFFLIDQDGKIHDANRISESLLGLNKDQLVVTHMNDILHDDDRDRFVMFLNELRHLGAVPPSEMRLRKKNGEELIVSVSAVFIDFNSYLVIMCDLTAKKQDEDRVREVEGKLQLWEKKFDSLVQSVPAVVYTWRFNGDFSCLYASPFVEHLTGFDADVTMSENLLLKNIHEQDYNHVIDALKRHMDTGESFFHLTYRMKNRKNTELHVVNRGYIELRGDGIFEIDGTIVAVNAARENSETNTVHDTRWQYAA